MGHGLRRRRYLAVDDGVGLDRASSGTKRPLRRFRLPRGLGGGRATGPGASSGNWPCWDCCRWWGWPLGSWLGPLVLSLGARGDVENLALIVVQFLSRIGGATRPGLESATTRSSVARPREDSCGVVVAHDAAGPLSSAQHAGHRQHRPTVRTRARYSTCGARLSPPRTPRSSCTSTVGRGPSATSASRDDRCCTNSSSADGSWSPATTGSRPGHLWPAHIMDAKRVLGWIKKNIANYGGDPERVVVAGGSAGGHLASLLALSTREEWLSPRLRLTCPTGRCAGASRCTACSR